LFQTFVNVNQSGNRKDMKKFISMISAALLLTSCAVFAVDSNGKFVFITSLTYDSNLGGLKGADEKCQAEADDPASVIPAGTYRAWLSDGTNSPNTRFTRSALPYLLPDGKKIAENYDDLIDGSILAAINLGPTGKPSGYQAYWTGTNPDGTTATDDDYNGVCGGWAVAPPAGKWGMTGHTAKKSTLWTTEHGQPCRRTLKLACFQQ
jgi:hypothetical protein